MELSLFVSQTITEICKGVAEARRQCPGSVIAPSITTMGTVAKSECGEIPQTIHFEIDVEVIEGADDGKKAFLNVPSIVGIGAKSGEHSESRTGTHISFDLPVVWERRPLPLFPDE